MSALSPSDGGLPSAIAVLGGEALTDPAPGGGGRIGVRGRRPYLLYVLRRVVQAVVVIVLAYVVAFLVISVLGSNPIQSTLSNPQAGLSPASVKKLEAYYGVNGSFLHQLWLGLSRFLRGQFGTSLQYHLPVSHLILTALPYTLKLGAAALLISIVFACLFAYGSQRFPLAAGRSFIRSIPSFFLSVPNFVIGLLLIQVFSFELHAFDVLSPDNLIGTTCAAFALAIPISAPLAEVLIANLDTEGSQEYVLVARSRGLSETRIFLRHLVKPSSVPAITMFAIIIGELMGGALITEEVFGRTGLGTVMFQAVSTGDAPVLQAIVALAAAVFVTANLIADLIAPLVDPRIDLVGPRAAPGLVRGLGRGFQAGNILGGAAMSVTVVPPPARQAVTARRLRVFSLPPTVLLSFVIVAIVLAWALFPSLFTSSSPVNAVPLDKFLPMSSAHWFGTDYLGRDNFTRIVYGTRSSVLNAFVAVGIGLLVGGALGLLAGFFGGLVDATIGRSVDVLLAIPGFLLAVVIVVSLGFRTINVAVATGITMTAIFARIMRAETLKVRQAVFVESSYLQGGSRMFVLFRHILPNARRSVLALAVLQLGNAIIIIAAIAFLGYGSPPPAADWGSLISEGAQYQQIAPWLIYCPAVVVVVTVLAINRISRWLRNTN